MTTGWRILFKDIIYDVKSALIPEMARKEIEIFAKSGDKSSDDAHRKD